ncbi:hypothetical protein CEXT_234461 [Caerostris extrusa]|uniref:Uncharacterized protein n=1 Tax=Caerostris extrusa TaxID=172846 RepID=A0AAV4P404_CAEEX|nr:hypothetical protein CEXT_234461 [Caerostris extrusa]
MRSPDISGSVPNKGRHPQEDTLKMTTSSPVLGLGVLANFAACRGGGGWLGWIKRRAIHQTPTDYEEEKRGEQVKRRSRKYYLPPAMVEGTDFKMKFGKGKNSQFVIHL